MTYQNVCQVKTEDAMGVDGKRYGHDVWSEYGETRPRVSLLAEPIMGPAPVRPCRSCWYEGIACGPGASWSGLCRISINPYEDCPIRAPVKAAGWGNYFDHWGMINSCR